MKFNNVLNSFHIDFLKFTSQRTASGQRELRDLAQKISELEATTRQYVERSNPIPYTADESDV